MCDNSNDDICLILLEIKGRQQYSEKIDLLTVRRLHELECNLSEVIRFFRYLKNVDNKRKHCVCIKIISTYYHLGNTSLQGDMTFSIYHFYIT